MIIDRVACFEIAQIINHVRRERGYHKDYGRDTVIDCEDDFAMMQIENRAIREITINAESTADKMFRSLLEDHIVSLGRIHDDYHPEAS